jgi:hypothetical protein
MSYPEGWRLRARPASSSPLSSTPELSTSSWSEKIPSAAVYAIGAYFGLPPLLDYLSNEIGLTGLDISPIASATEALQTTVPEWVKNQLTIGTASKLPGLPGKWLVAKLSVPETVSDQESTTVYATCNYIMEKLNSVSNFLPDVGQTVSQWWQGITQPEVTQEAEDTFTSCVNNASTLTPLGSRVTIGVDSSGVRSIGSHLATNTAIFPLRKIDEIPILTAEMSDKPPLLPKDVQIFLASLAISTLILPISLAIFSRLQRKGPSSGKLKRNRPLPKPTATAIKDMQQLSNQNWTRVLTERINNETPPEKPKKPWEPLMNNKNNKSEPPKRKPHKPYPVRLFGRSFAIRRYSEPNPPTDPTHSRRRQIASRHRNSRLPTTPTQLTKPVRPVSAPENIPDFLRQGGKAIWPGSKDPNYNERPPIEMPKDFIE